MNASLVLLNGPDFAHGDEVIVQYQGDFNVAGSLLGKLVIENTLTDVAAQISFSATFDKPTGITGYEFVQDFDDPSVWIGNVI